MSSVARQTAVGSTYTIGASVITLVVGFTRSVILARLLFPEDFGLFALAFFFVGLVERVQLFGFTSAFIHKHNHTEAEVAAHFLLSTSLSLLVVLLAVLITPLLSFFYPELPTLGVVVVVVTAVRLIYALNHTPRTILTKQLQFKRLAVLRIGGSVLALGVTVWLAQRGAGVWALVAQDACFLSSS
ncbi:MAG: oligosaccharide flippase family protein [Anaerolineaceae bacterium]|nr:oligosaccharide flippase family protein [Anaerolineaceae bacterium]